MTNSPENPQHDFTDWPATDDACPFVHQVLRDDRERLARDFDAMFGGTTARDYLAESRRQRNAIDAALAALRPAGAAAIALVALLSASPADAARINPFHSGPYWPGHEVEYWGDHRSPFELTTYLNQNSDGPGAKGRPPITLCHYSEQGRGIGQARFGCPERPVPVVVPTDPETPEIPETPEMPAIPLPASLPLFLAALAGLVGLRRRAQG